MFHVMLVLPVLIIIAILIAIFLFSVFTIVASIIGGASTALLIKDKSIKRLLFIGFCILSLIGLICLIPFITIYASLPELFFSLAEVIACACVAILAIVGIRYSAKIQNKIWKTVLIVIFGLILAVAVSLAILVPIVRGFLLSS